MRSQCQEECNKGLFLEAIRPLAKRLVRVVPLPLLMRLSRLPKSARLIAEELLSRGWRWNPGGGLARPVDLIPGLHGSCPSAQAAAQEMTKGIPGPPVSVSDYAQVLFGQGTDVRGKRVAVLAHWDPEGLLDPYVIHYLSHLRELGWLNVVVSANSPDLDQKARLVVDVLVRRGCPGYDFTSWKAALQKIPDLIHTKELLLTNDSIFAPVGSLAGVHDAMKQVACDFWGMVESHEVQPHLQSYYMVFRSPALQHESFMRFWDGVAASPRRQDAVRSEVTLSLWLALNGLVPGAFVTAVTHPFNVLNPTYFAWRQLIELGAPIIKRDLLRFNPVQVDIRGWQAFLASRGYPLELTSAYLHRMDSQA